MAMAGGGRNARALAGDDVGPESKRLEVLRGGVGVGEHGVYAVEGSERVVIAPAHFLVIGDDVSLIGPIQGVGEDRGGVDMGAEHLVVEDAGRGDERLGGGEPEKPAVAAW